MRKDAAPSACDMVGCDKPATGSFMRARGTQLLEFSICDGHYSRLQLDDRARVVVEDGFELALILERAERDN